MLTFYLNRAGKNLPASRRKILVQAKDEFLGVMSHELRTPITAVYGGTRVLRSRGERLDDESKARLLEDIEQESERLFRMVENLLVLSRLELGQQVATEPVLAQRVVAKLASSFRQRRPARSRRWPRAHAQRWRPARSGRSTCGILGRRRLPASVRPRALPRRQAHEPR